MKKQMSYRTQSKSDISQEKFRKKKLSKFTVNKRRVKKVENNFQVEEKEKKKCYLVK